MSESEVYGAGEDDGRAIVSVVPEGNARGVVIRRPQHQGHVVRWQSGPALRPWEATGSIEVEALVVWAYRDQRVDRFANVGLHMIERAVAGLEPRGRSSDGCAAIADIAHMGCRVDVPGAIVKDSVHPVAEAVADALNGIEGAHLVAHYGRHAGRPEGWSPPDRRYRPVMWVDPGVDAQWERSDSGHRYCPIISAGSPDEVQRCRRDYRLWWDALDQLAWALSMRALGFAVLRPSAPRVPWLTQGEAS